jgi:glycosyltransferase involved in cell wall biosynthesis
MKVAILYDCMFPYTVGGAERWYVNIAERLSKDHVVTYVTLKQWDQSELKPEPFDVVTVGPRMELYTESGRRKIGPPVRYGLGVFWHLLRHGGKYDVVHGASFPYFSVIAAWLALLPRKTKLVVDWHELWTLNYWTDYLGPIGGRIGWFVQWLCTLMPDQNFAFSRLHAKRLKHGRVTQFTGEFVEQDRPQERAPMHTPPTIVFAGRQIPEKNAAVLPAAIAHARSTFGDLRGLIFGDGPEREKILAAIEEADASAFVAAPGFVDHDVLDERMRSAACMVLPSIREGYGMIVVEAVSLGIPSVVVAGEDNAATELVEPGVNGFIASSSDPVVLGDAIVQALTAGDELRASTWQWYDEHKEMLSIDDSIEKINAAYAALT